MPLRGEDHIAVSNWCKALEARPARLGTKSAPMVFPSFGGDGGYGGAWTANGWGGNGGSWTGNYLPGAQYDYASEAGELWRNSAVAACQRWVNDNFSEPTLIVQERDREGEWQTLADHPLLEQLAAPNPYYGTDELNSGTNTSLAVSGDGYWIKARSPSRRKMELYWAPYWEIVPKWSTSGTSYIDYYDHVVDGRKQRIEVEDIVHFRRGLSPTNVRHGQALLEPFLREICADNSGATYRAATLRNFGWPRVVLMPGDEGATLDDPQSTAIKQFWRENSSGEEAGSALVSSLRFEVKELTLKPDDMALDVMLRIPEGRICAAFGLPPAVVGLAVGEDQRTYANMAVMDRFAYRNCLVPLQKIHAKTLTKQLLPDFGGKPNQRVWFDYSGVEAMNEETNSKANRAVKLFMGGLITRNEGRRMVGEKEDPAAGDVYLDKPTSEPLGANVNKALAGGEET